MKKRWLTIYTAGLLLFLSGCSYFNETYNTLDYAKDASNYLKKVTTFAAETPPLLQQAVTNEQAAAELQTKLQQMKKDIQTFNNLDAPETVTNFHQRIIEQNNLLLTQINTCLDALKDGQLDSSILDATQLLQPVQEITNTINQLKKLNNQVNEILNGA